MTCKCTARLIMQGLLVALATLSLCSCQSLAGTGTPSVPTPPAVPTPIEPAAITAPPVAPRDIAASSPDDTPRSSLSTDRLHHCQAQLDVLRTLKSSQYLHLKQDFDSLMHGASLYAGLRDNVNGDTQNTVDALYLYRVNYLCARITQSVMTGLVTLGDAAK